MKIFANRRKDILKLKQDWELEHNAKFDEYKQDLQMISDEYYRITKPIEDDLNQIIGANTSSLSTYITVYRGYRGSLEIRLRFSEHDFSDDAFSWIYSISLNKIGKVTQTIYSWSNIDVASIDVLLETAETIKRIESINWRELVNKPRPSYEDLHKENIAKYGEDVPDFDQMLIEADVSEVVNQPILLKGRYPSLLGTVYYMVLRETRTQYEVVQIPVADVERSNSLSEALQGKQPYKISKAKFIERLIKPIEKVEVS